ncbi:MAG: EamA family transporter [Alphaproteobacteria bacterium]
MDLWIPITIAAAFAQNLRTALQKHLTGRLTTLGATFARFVFGLPFAALYLWLVTAASGQSLPRPDGLFAIYGAVGGLAQILATFCLLSAFRFRNFAVGTTYSKTETVQTALIGAVILGETLSMGAAIGIAVSLAGVVAISTARSRLTLRSILTGWTEKAALIGLASGGLFGVSAVCYRAASLALDSGDALIRAATTLLCVLAFQTVAMTLYLALRDRGQILRVFRHWRWTLWVGLIGMLGSAGWFTAMTLQQAAYVRALGQIELVFTFAASILFFRERTMPAELVGIALVVAGILFLLLL